MRFATVTPRKLLEPLQSYLGDYHLILAQEVLAHEDYAAFYRACSRRGDYVILDNGAAESETITGDSLRSAYDLVRPAEIIAPDALNNRVTTRELARIFFEHEWVKEARKRGLKVMVVPQGNSWADWCDSLLELYIHEPDCIGLSKFDCEFIPDVGSSGRWSAVHKVVEMSLHAYLAEVHLLGLFGSPMELALVPSLYKGRFVRGADSTLPIAAAANYEYFDERFGSLSRPSSWEYNSNLEPERAILEIAAHNIRLCRMWGQEGFR